MRGRPPTVLAEGHVLADGGHRDSARHQNGVTSASRGAWISSRSRRLDLAASWRLDVVETHHPRRLHVVLVPREHIAGAGDRCEA
jgi:hypothetical protein